MAFVRKKGNQVVIVHGRRDLDTKKVQQQTLFVFYSKAEALAAIGDSSHWFQGMLQDEFPEIRFNWKQLKAGISAQLPVLPDLYQYKQARVNHRFRDSVVDFTRELLIADPQELMSAARVLQEQRFELEYVRDLIDWRIKLADQKPSEWNADSPFYWKTLMNRSEVPIEGREQLDDLFLKGEYEKAKPLARLLIDCWDNFAEGYNYLGLIAMDNDELVAAQEWFTKGMRVGRTLFPNRIRKDRYWSDHATRPYIRAIVYLAQAHNRLGEFEQALRLCEKLEQECTQDITAATERIPIYLNQGAFEQVVQSAQYVHLIYPQENLPLALALFEIGALTEARVHFLCGAIRFPRAANMLCGYSRKNAPKTSDEIDDHNMGVAYLRDLAHYLSKYNVRARRYFRGMLKNAAVSDLIDEAKTVGDKWRNNRSSDRTWFDRRNEMESIEFAKSKVREIWPD